MSRSTATAAIDLSRQGSISSPRKADPPMSQTGALISGSPRRDRGNPGYSGTMIVQDESPQRLPRRDMPSRVPHMNNIALPVDLAFQELKTVAGKSPIVEIAVAFLLSIKSNWLVTSPFDLHEDTRQ